MRVLVHSLDVQKVLLDTRPLVGHLCKAKFLNQWHLEFIADITELVTLPSFSLVS